MQGMIMVKHLPLAVLTALLLAACGSSDKPPAEKPAPAENQNVLKIYNWSEYVDPETVADFERKTASRLLMMCTTVMKRWKARC